MDLPNRTNAAPRCHHGLPAATCVFCSPSYWPVMLVWAGAVVLLWLAIGPAHPAFVLFVTAWTWLLGPGVARPVMRQVPPAWFLVRRSERVLHRVLGVGLFAALLERSGWNRHVAGPVRGFDRTRSGLRSLEQSVRGAASAHGTCFAIHMALAAVAAVTGHRWGALWLLLAGVVPHLYPTLLQRSLMLRLQPLLDRSGQETVAAGTGLPPSAATL